MLYAIEWSGEVKVVFYDYYAFCAYYCYMRIGGEDYYLLLLLLIYYGYG